MSRAPYLRKSVADCERILWCHLRNRNFANYKFRRQHPVDRYILDFYCAQALEWKARRAVFRGAHAPRVPVSAPRRNQRVTAPEGRILLGRKKCTMTRASSPAREARALPWFALEERCPLPLRYVFSAKGRWFMQAWGNAPGKRCSPDER